MSPAVPLRPMPFISRVRIDNYKSIAHCDVTLGRFTVLLGLNAAGKSNFLDALRFVRDALVKGPEEAVAARGGWGEVLRRVPEPATSCTIGVEFQLDLIEDDPGPWMGRYEITLAPLPASGAGRRDAGPGVRIQRELCEMHRPDAKAHTDTEHFLERDRTEKGRRHRLMGLSRTADDEPFLDLHVALTKMFFYSPDLSSLREARPNTPTAGALGEDGGDLGPALAALGDQERDRISQYLGVIVPGVVEVGPTDPSADYIAARISFATNGESEPHIFRAESMSEGTIRAIGLLTALFQPSARDGWGRIPLIAVEEPELALHPLAAGALYDALTEASEYVQVLVTTQSAELFDRKEADLSAIRVVAAEHGVTVIGEVDPVSRSIVADGLATTAELLRSDQLRPVVEPPAQSDEEPEGEE
jgi:predicted ATPase